MDHLSGYLRYHEESAKARDIDPANDMLRYLADRFELNLEQRYWLAFLYATSYSTTTAYFMYNEFPDFETADPERMRQWWSKHRENLLFQTDRRWCRSRNQWVACFESYRELVYSMAETQHGLFTVASKSGGSPEGTYDVAMTVCADIFTFGRFTLFLFLDAVNSLTTTNMNPSSLDLKNAESSRKGLAFALGASDRDFKSLSDGFRKVCKAVHELDIDKQHKTVWAIETCLCAYRKHKEDGRRWVGYYIERQKKEIEKLQSLVTEGVHWGVLWDFRSETYQPKYLK